MWKISDYLLDLLIFFLSFCTFAFLVFGMLMLVLALVS